MRTAKKRGPGPSHLLLTPDHAGNVVGIDPHKRTLTAVRALQRHRAVARLDRGGARASRSVTAITPAATGA